VNPFARNCLAILAGALLLAAGAGIVVVSNDLHAVLTDIDAAVRDSDSMVRAAEQDELQLDLHLNSIMQSAQVAADQAALFAMDQRALLAKTSHDSDKTVMALRLVIDRAGMLFQHADRELAANSVQLQDTVRKMGLSADSMTTAGDTLNVRFTDPHWADTLAHLDETSTRLAEIGGNVSRATSDAEHEIHKFVYPPPRPWYDKYIIDPLKMGMRMLTIPLTHG
jgi:hypothetical protein